MQSIREAFLKKEIPEESIEIMLASLSNSTLKQYGCALSQWRDFATKEKIDFYDVNVKTVLKFLAERFNLGASYGTLNSCRSALSLISKEKIGEHPHITRFMKGIFRLKPSRPKYAQTWDVSIVLNYLQNIDDTNLENLTYKTVLLLALSTAHRAQTLSKIKISNIRHVNDGLEIKIPELIKTSGPGRYQPILQLPFFVNKPTLCVASTVLSYIDKTKNIRKDIDQLIISIKRPIPAVSSQTLSRWVKKCLHNSGIDVSIFSSHSTRHAATSTAFLKGIDLNTIRRTAGWSESSQMFANIYNRPIVQNNFNFARAIFE